MLSVVLLGSAKSIWCVLSSAGWPAPLADLTGAEAAVCHHQFPWPCIIDGRGYSITPSPLTKSLGLVCVDRVQCSLT